MKKVLLIAGSLLLTACTAARPVVSNDTASSISSSQSSKSQGYVLEFLNDSEFSEYYDERLVHRDPVSGKEEVLVPSVKAALPELQQTDNLTLILIGQPKGANVLILRSALMDTDNPGGSFYSFDIPARRFTILKNISSAYAGFGAFDLAPDLSRALHAPDEDKGNIAGFSQTLYVFDFLRDTAKPVLRLSGQETFNAGLGALSSHFDIAWIDNSVIQFAVFDQNTKPEQFWGPESLATVIETRELRL